MSPQEKSNLIKDILSEAAQISDPIIRQDLIKNLAQVGGVEENQVVHMFTQQMRKKRPRHIEATPKPKKSLFTSVNAKAELGIIKVLAGDDQEARALIQSDLDINLIENDQLKKLAEMLMGTNNVKPAEIMAHFDSAEDREIVSQILIDEDDSTSPIQMAQDCLATLSKVSTKEKIKAARIKIREMEAAGQDTTNLMMEVVKMQKDLRG